MKRHVVCISLLLASSAFAAVEGREVVVKDRTFGCRTPEATQRFYQMALKDRKTDAAKYAMKLGCLMFPSGTVVAVVDPLPLLEVNGVRFKDDPNVYYVPAAAAR